MKRIGKISHKIFSLMELILQTDIFFSDIVELTVQRIRIKKLRSFLTVLGIGVGISVVYFLVSLTFGLQKLVIGRIATSESLLSLDVLPNTEIRDFIKLNSAVIEEIEKIDKVTEVSGVRSLPAEISFNNIKAQTLAYGVKGNYFRLSGVTTDKGELFSDQQEEGVVVSSAISSLFGVSEDDLIGAKIRLSFILSEESLSSTENATEAAEIGAIKVVEIPMQLTIMGIVNDDTNYVYLHQNNFMVVSLDEFKSAKVKVSSQEEIDRIRDEIVAKGFLVSAMTDTLQQINNIFRVTQVTFTVVGIVALFVAAIGMFNTMTVSLLERTREIGIMKAIGATEKGIKQMFLTESLIMGLLGGIGGLAIGFILTLTVGVIVNLLAFSLGGESVKIFYTPAWFVLLVIGFSLLIGLVTGIFPARRAAKLNPLDALRYE